MYLRTRWVRDRRAGNHSICCTACFILKISTVRASHRWAAQPAGRVDPWPNRIGSERACVFGRTGEVEWSLRVERFPSAERRCLDWAELQNDEDCQRELGLSQLANARPPVVILPDGTHFEAPTVNALAHRLGWVT